MGGSEHPLNTLMGWLAGKLFGNEQRLYSWGSEEIYLGQTDQTQVPATWVKGQDEPPTIGPQVCLNDAASMLWVWRLPTPPPPHCPIEASVGLRQVDFHQLCHSHWRLVSLLLGF
jgi:hypothetical protein